MPDFDTATTLTATPEPGHFAVQIDPDRQAGGRVNGGCLLALL